MTTINRPQSLEEIPTLIEEFQHTSLHADRFQQEYKRQVGISSSTHSVHYFHPEALDLELKDQQDYFHILKNRYINLLGKQKFLECILQEPQVDITDLDLLNIEDKNKTMLAEIKSYNVQTEAIAAAMKSTVNIVDEEKLELMRTFDKTEIVGSILTEEQEIAIIRQKLNNKSDLTLVEAEEILLEQTENLTKLGKYNDEKKEAIEEFRWEVEEKQRRVEDMITYTDQLMNEADEAIKFKDNQNENIGIQYKEYKEAINMYNLILFGAKSIDFSSEDVIHVTFTSKYKDAVLHIYIDYENKRVGHATIDGPQIKLDNIINMVQSTSVNNGIRTMILETLDCLKKL